MKFKLSKHLIIFPLVFIFIILAFFMAGLFWFRENSKAVSGDTSKERVVITKGASANQVGQKLYEAKLIRNPFAFKLYVQLFNRAKSINAGVFSLSPSMNLTEIIEALSKGPEELWVTIPEGLRRQEVVERVISSLQMDNIRASTFKDEFLNLTSDKEGYLFPDSYLFPPDTSATSVVVRMTSTFDKKFDDEMKKRISEGRYELNDYVVMASLIERETKTNEERPVVAGILWKRLEADWPLQVDASVQYAVASAKCLTPSVCDNWWPILTKEDLEIKSGFNTYKYTGLPPSPISNPGLSSISASVYPQDSDYWFYLHAPNGEIHYAKTIEEHNSNIKKYLGK